MSTTDPIRTIADALTESPVYVDPILTNEVPADVADDLVATIEANDLPVYVVVYPLDYNDQFNGRSSQLLALVQEEAGRDGVYVHADSDDRLETYGVGVDDYWEAASVASDEPTTAADLERFLDLVISGEAPGILDQSWETESGSGGSGPDADGVPAPVLGLIATVVIIALIVVGVVVARANRRPAKAVRRAYDVPDDVVEAVRRSQESTVAAQARARVLALGEALDHTNVPSEADALTEYRAALDAYDAAGRTLDADDDLHVTDAVGALVLAETGQAHLERALGSARDRRRDPARPCFFNPLHGAARHAVKLPGDADTRVPACAACAKSVRAGRQPQALMVRASGTTAPYYETDLQPWAATGYGSIDPDWVDKVLTRGVNP